MSLDDPQRPTPPDEPAAPLGPSAEQSPVLALEVIAGESTGTRMEIDDELLIGRLTGGPGQVSDDEVSREHARISREQAGGYAIEDLGSSNGTFVNGSRLGAPRLLAEEDLIEVGATTLLVKEIRGETASADVPDEHSGLARTGPLTLNLRVDFDKREASVELGVGEDLVRLHLAEGRWHTVRDGPIDGSGSGGSGG